MRRVSLIAAAALVHAVVLASPAAAQGSTSLRRAVEAYDNLSYGQAIALARQATRERLPAADRARAYEVLGSAYAALDSARPATEAFKQLLLLDPDRELDSRRVSPKITSIFALALGQVLVVRHLSVDSAAFIAGVGTLPIRFTASRTARLRTRVAGPTGEITVDSVLGEGTVNLRWNGLLESGVPPSPGIYRVIVEASAGRDSYAASSAIRVVPGAVDTLSHLSSLPGYELLPETVIPARSWKPVGLALLATGVAMGGSLAFDHSKLEGGGRREILAIGASTALIGFLASTKKPAAVPAPANILYNSLVREQLARRNAEIATENETRRRQVRLEIFPEPQTVGSR